MIRPLRVSEVSSFMPAINEFAEISEELRICVGLPLTFIILTVVTSSPPPLVLIFRLLVSDWSKVALDLLQTHKYPLIKVFI